MLLVAKMCCPPGDCKSPGGMGMGTTKRQARGPGSSGEAWRKLALSASPWCGPEQIRRPRYRTQTGYRPGGGSTALGTVPWPWPQRW